MSAFRDRYCLQYLSNCTPWTFEGTASERLQEINVGTLKNDQVAMEVKLLTIRKSACTEWKTVDSAYRR